MKYFLFDIIPVKQVQYILSERWLGFFSIEQIGIQKHSFLEYIELHTALHILHGLLQLV